MREACRDKEAEPHVLVNVGMSLPQKLTFLVENPVQSLCPGTPRLLVGLFSSSPVLLFVLDVKTCEWLTFYRQDPHTEKSRHFFQLSCLCGKLLKIGICVHGNFPLAKK
uniref:Uncharacterized protein n=1 Tax=Macaca fascicularis TaxID=9541 RepID=Q9BE13_MACFA|nr:hypothetical protein [Macaca fascicularis]